MSGEAEPFPHSTAAEPGEVGTACVSGRNGLGMDTASACCPDVGLAIANWPPAHAGGSDLIGRPARRSRRRSAVGYGGKIVVDHLLFIFQLVGQDGDGKFETMFDKQADVPVPRWASRL